MGDRSAIGVLGVLAVLGACGQGSSAKPGGDGVAAAAGSLAGALGGAAPLAPAPAPAPAAAVPASAAVPELIGRDFYRAPGGISTFVYPTVPAFRDQRWTRQLSRDGAVAVIKLLFVDGPRRAQVELRFPPAQPRPIPARAFAEALAPSVAKAMPGAQVLSGRELPVPGGTAWGVGVAAETAGGRVVAGVTVIAEGNAAVLVTTMAQAAVYDAPEVAPVLDAVFRGVRVGARVLVPPALEPGVRRAGVYLRVGPALGELHTLVFDPRGHVHDDAASGLDLDGLYQRGGGTAGRYTATASEVRITDERGRVDVATVNGVDLTLGGRTYCLAATTEGWTLDGSWTSPTFVSHVGPTETFTASASSRYHFAGDGTFRASSSASATLAAPAAAGGAPRVTGGGGDSDRGRYRIAGDRLVLRYDSGVTRALPFYARACGGKPSTAMLAIDGALYLHDD